MDTIIFDTPLGRLCVASEEGDAVSGLYFPQEDQPAAESCETFLLNRAKCELLEYFSGCRACFDLPLCLRGTLFQRQVWTKLLEIPFGETRSYGQIASAIGKPGAAKAVGGACRRNPIPILIPCHRVVGADGRLTGFSGGLEVKAHLLKLELRKEAIACKNSFVPASDI